MDESDRSWDHQSSLTSKDQPGNADSTDSMHNHIHSTIVPSFHVDSFPSRGLREATPQRAQSGTHKCKQFTSKPQQLTSSSFPTYQDAKQLPPRMVIQSTQSGSHNSRYSNSQSLEYSPCKPRQQVRDENSFNGIGHAFSLPPSSRGRWLQRSYSNETEQPAAISGSYPGRRDGSPCKPRQQVRDENSFNAIGHAFSLPPSSRGRWLQRSYSNETEQPAAISGSYPGRRDGGPLWPAFNPQFELLHPIDDDSATRRSSLKSVRSRSPSIFTHNDSLCQAGVFAFGSEPKAVFRYRSVLQTRRQVIPSSSIRTHQARRSSPSLLPEDSTIVPLPGAFSASDANQQREILAFAANANSFYGATASEPWRLHAITPTPNQKVDIHQDEVEDDDNYHDILSSCYGYFIRACDLNVWLASDVRIDDSGGHYFDNSWTLAALVRNLLFNPVEPEFTSLQQFCWAVVIGLIMGLYTAIWKQLIDYGISFMWTTVPHLLLQIGVFTRVGGGFPLYHYMWMCPAICSGFLSYILAVLSVTIPNQNDWINCLHARGVQDYRSFFTIFVLSTLGMVSGLSLGPELPLVLTGGAFGSWVAIICKQSILQARVMNLTAASGAVAGFFGFPMAGALFVLELPHRMGLQYFEALSPATVCSIVAVLSNRLILKNDVTGYFKYPLFNSTLPSAIFSSAIVYGLYGTAVGIVYARCTMYVKMKVHNLLDEEHTGNDLGALSNSYQETRETDPLVKGIDRHYMVTKPKLFSILLKRSDSIIQQLKALVCAATPERKHKAAAEGLITGALVGITGMFLPHVMFWGEAQLQNLIDKGRSPLPIFGDGSESTTELVTLARCMIQSTENSEHIPGFGIGCSFWLGAAKMLVVGLSVGTGITGGHFWGPLFCGCAAAHMFTDIAVKLSPFSTVASSLAAHPCVVLLCTMGSAHVVTFRAHMAIILILTLTISTFERRDNGIGAAGDYSAVIPLLVVSIFVSLMLSRDTVFYRAQRSRGDITAVPEVLCEPGREGKPMVMDYDRKQDEISLSSAENDCLEASDLGRVWGGRNNTVDAFNSLIGKLDNIVDKPTSAHYSASASDTLGSHSPVQTTIVSQGERKESWSRLSSSRLDELLSKPTETNLNDRLSLEEKSCSVHRRTLSTPNSQSLQSGQGLQTSIPPTPELVRTDSKSSLVRISTFGEVREHQPSLLDQARLRSASSGPFSRHRRATSLTRPGHSRQGSQGSTGDLSVKSEKQGTPQLDGKKDLAAAIAPGKLLPSPRGRSFSDSVWTDTPTK